MGRHKRKTSAWSEAASKRTKAYWDKKSKEPSTCAGGEATLPAEPLPTPTSPAYDVQVSTPAIEREKLLAGKLVDEGDVDDDNALVIISIRRLKELLRGNTCDVCGERTNTSIEKKYFDCVVKVTCSNCEVLLCRSEARKTKGANFTEGNAILLYHSLSDGYGKAGLSRLSALFGTHDMPQAVFMNHAKYLYSAMTGYYEKQQAIVHDTVKEVITREGDVEPMQEKVKIGVVLTGHG